MKNAIAILVLFALLVPAGCATRDSGVDRPQTVDSVDLNRYAGLWYEIARIPNRFQRQCTGTVTARYTLRDDGRIDVVNRCETADRAIIEARGVARAVDPSSNSRLEVSFVAFLGIRLFWGDYWIFDLGPDYSYALVGSPDRRYGWILSRTPQLPASTIDRIHRRLEAVGYDPAAFTQTVHRTQTTTANPG